MPSLSADRVHSERRRRTLEEKRARALQRKEDRKRAVQLDEQERIDAVIAARDAQQAAAKEERRRQIEEKVALQRAMNRKKKLLEKKREEERLARFHERYAAMQEQAARAARPVSDEERGGGTAGGGDGGGRRGNERHPRGMDESELSAMSRVNSYTSLARTSSNDDVGGRLTLPRIGSNGGGSNLSRTNSANVLRKADDDDDDDGYGWARRKVYGGIEKEKQASLASQQAKAVEKERKAKIRQRKLKKKRKDGEDGDEGMVQLQTLSINMLDTGEAVATANRMQADDHLREVLRKGRKEYSYPRIQYMYEAARVRKQVVHDRLHETAFGDEADKSPEPTLPGGAVHGANDFQLGDIGADLTAALNALPADGGASANGDELVRTMEAARPDDVAFVAAPVHLRPHVRQAHESGHEQVQADKPVFYPGSDVAAARRQHVEPAMTPSPPPPADALPAEIDPEALQAAEEGRDEPAEAEANRASPPAQRQSPPRRRSNRRKVVRASGAAPPPPLSFAELRDGGGGREVEATVNSLGLKLPSLMQGSEDVRGRVLEEIDRIKRDAEAGDDEQGKSATAMF